MWIPHCIPASLLDGLSWWVAHYGSYLVWVAVVGVVQVEDPVGLAQGILLV